MSRKPITSKNYADEAMTLVDEATFAPICEGDQRTLRDGQKHVVRGGRAPHKESSTGRVYTSEIGEHDTWEGEYYPAVIGAKWMHDETLRFHEAAQQTRANVRTRLRKARARDAATDVLQPTELTPVFKILGLHAEAPETITAVNKARQKARRAVIKSKQQQKGAK